jgi:hypothetical protein
MSAHTPRAITIKNTTGINIYHISRSIERMAAGRCQEDQGEGSNHSSKLSGSHTPEAIIAAAPALLAALEEVEIHYVPKGCEYQPTGKSCADTPAFAPCSPCKARAAIRAAREAAA